MKSLQQLIRGIAASLLLAAGLHAAAAKVDPVTNGATLNKPESSTDELGKVSSMPCTSCVEPEE